MSLLRKVAKLIESEWALAATTKSLLYDGNDIFLVDDLESRLISGGRRPGQALFPISIHVAAIPVGLWIDAARELGTEIDLSKERAVRRDRKEIRERLRATASFSLREDIG